MIAFGLSDSDKEKVYYLSITKEIMEFVFTWLIEIFKFGTGTFFLKTIIKKLRNALQRNKENFKLSKGNKWIRN